MKGKLWCSFLLLIPFIASAITYTSYDDATWAVTSANISDMFGSSQKELYQRFMKDCSLLTPTCVPTEEFRLRQNQYQPRGVYNFTEMGFKKVRAPAAVMKLLSDFWEAHKDNLVEEPDNIDPFRNTWDTPTSKLDIHNRSLVGVDVDLGAAVANAARELMEEWTGMRVVSTSVYGIRVYHDGSILTPHVDRMPLVSSCIINVAQDVEEEWVLEVYGHDGKAHNVTMEPGDLVLYESHSVIHGRPFPLKGKYYANVFVHFEPVGPVNTTTVPDLSYPPYLVPGSEMDKVWRKSNPKGWPVFRDIFKLVGSNDIVALEYLAQVNASRLEETDDNGWAPIHEAARLGNVEVMKFLYEHGADINKYSRVLDGVTPLAVAEQLKGHDHAITSYLRSIGAKSTSDLVQDAHDDESEGSDKIGNEL